MITVSGGKREQQVAEALGALEAQRPRIMKLRRYQAGRHDIVMRERKEGLPNVRLPHGFPHYIANMSAGYLMGEGVQVRFAGDAPATDRLRRALCQSQSPALDMTLAYNQAAYGAAYSLSWLRGQAGDRRQAMQTGVLPNECAALVCDSTAARKPLFGMLWVGDVVSVYDERCLTRYRAAGQGRLQPLDGPRPHGFDAIPLICYRNNEEEQGDFEPVIPLIDAYDLLASDRLNDREQFADALLVLTGVMGLGAGGQEGDGGKAQKLLRQSRMLSLPDTQAKAEWLVKNVSEQDIDILRKALSDDIHKFSMTPDLEDDRFAGNISGIAMRYKLFCLEQRIRIKSCFFTDGLIRRVALVKHVLEQNGASLPPMEKLEVKYLRLRLEEATRS